MVAKGDLELGLSALLRGEISFLSTILGAAHADLLKAAEIQAPLVVTRSALISVLSNWQNGRCSDTEVQRWASFVRHGYVAPGSKEPILPLDICYDEPDEDLIVEIVGRFDEIGDVIDGTIDDIEQQQMLAALQA